MRDDATGNGTGLTALDQPSLAMGLDDRPYEMARLGHLFQPLGYSLRVLDRLTTIESSIAAVRSGCQPRPKLIAIDLSWDINNKTFAMLGRSDIAVPTEPYRRGFVMMRDVLAEEEALRGIPYLIVSNFLSSYRPDFEEQLRALRAAGLTVEALSKLNLRDGDALNRLVGSVEKLGIELPVSRELPRGDMPILPPDKAVIDRGFEILSQDLRISGITLRNQWGYTGSDAPGDREAVFLLLRLSLKILLAMKTVFGKCDAQQALLDPDCLLKGVAPRDALISGQILILNLIKIELERRVGGAL